MRTHAIFGPGGNSESFYAAGYKATVQAPQFLAGMGLGAYEFEAGNGLTAGMDGETLLRTVLSGFELEILEKTPVCYRCYCSRDRVTRTLISLGREELRSIVAEGKPITIDCQFCDELYTFTPQQVQQILDSL